MGIKYISALIVLPLFLIILLFNKPGEEKVLVKNINPYYNSHFHIEVFYGVNGWGFDIYLDGKQYIHQPYIPLPESEKGFSSEEDAARTALLMVYKIKQNIVPPQLSFHELDSMKVDY
jgi:hypothetical protein